MISALSKCRANFPALVIMLHDVVRLLKKRFEQHARGSGLTRSQWQVLVYLARNEDTRQSALAELLEVVAQENPPACVGGGA
jgi:MarR family transcriptional regulator, transcriptional regulator for hemolysin